VIARLLQMIMMMRHVGDGAVDVVPAADVVSKDLVLVDVMLVNVVLEDVVFEDVTLVAVVNAMDAIKL
jgi:hypothetical protein